MSRFLLGVAFGVIVETTVVIGWLWLTSKPQEIKTVAARMQRQINRKIIRNFGRYPRRSERPDERRIVLRPVNKDEPPSRVTQALFRQRPNRKLDDNDTDRPR